MENVNQHTKTPPHRFFFRSTKLIVCHRTLNWDLSDKHNLTDSYLSCVTSNLQNIDQQLIFVVVVIMVTIYVDLFSFHKKINTPYISEAESRLYQTMPHFDNAIESQHRVKYQTRASSYIYTHTFHSVKQ